MTGVGQGIKLVGSKNFHVYVSVRWRHLNLKIKVVHSSLMPVTVYSAIIIYTK